ncbi:MAG: N-acetylmuramoyl-L-alanine amidase [Bacteroidales bacterium]|nr:N-acetylmuramoyl-L-alanine amidase [Bacteroidales bacterium]
MALMKGIRQMALTVMAVLAIAAFLPLYAQNNSGKIKCVVLDPGHGGHDHGCMSKDRKYSEKNIVLSVALKLGKIIEEEHPDVKVIYTRKRDVFIPLAERADIANRNKADLFLSIHVNANPSVLPSGSETFTMGSHVSDKNFEVSKRENAVIKMEDDYTTKYEGFNPDSPESYIIFSLLQNAYSEQSIRFASFIQDEYRKGPVSVNRGVKQAGFLVLWRTTMPSVLTEIGFLTNLSDKSKITTQEGQQKIARRLADAFTRYCDDYSSRYGNSLEEEAEVKPDDSQVTEPEVKTEPDLQQQTETQPKTVAEENTRYSIQIMAAKKKLKSNSSEFKGLKGVQSIYEKGFYKYHYGDYATRHEAAAILGDVRKKFSQAFIIGIKNGKIVSR